MQQTVLKEYNLNSVIKLLKNLLSNSNLDLMLFMFFTLFALNLDTTSLFNINADVIKPTITKLIITIAPTIEPTKLTKAIVEKSYIIRSIIQLGLQKHPCTKQSARAASTKINLFERPYSS